MYKRSHSQFCKGVSAKALWHILTDINNWATWHGDLDYCQLNGDFKVGNHFMLKPKGAPAVKIRLVDIVDGKSFTDCTHFLGARMHDTHTLEEIDGGVLISNELTVTGPLKWLWVKLVAKNVADTVPQEVDALVQLAKQQQVA